MNGERQDSNLAAARDGGINGTDDEHIFWLEWVVDRFGRCGCYFWYSLLGGDGNGLGHGSCPEHGVNAIGKVNRSAR
jgi:hypothetical protein